MRFPCRCPPANVTRKNGAGPFSEFSLESSPVRLPLAGRTGKCACYCKKYRPHIVMLLGISSCPLGQGKFLTMHRRYQAPGKWHGLQRFRRINRSQASVICLHFEQSASLDDLCALFTSLRSLLRHLVLATPAYVMHLTKVALRQFHLASARAIAGKHTSRDPRLGSMF